MLLRRRPSAQRVSKTAFYNDARGATTLLLTKLERLARSATDLSVIVHMLEDMWCCRRRTARRYTTSRTGKLVMGVLARITKFEKRRSDANGRWKGSREPRRPDRRAPQVRHAWKRYDHLHLRPGRTSRKRFRGDHAG
ncbi:recombinase family protein [Rhizobium sp. RAF56]|uniref:recombinase family protein n=1 Tax=Rhizobium sp. RAF56 TaxID=3233062 RepID=UPI003F95BA2B